MLSESGHNLKYRCTPNNLGAGTLTYTKEHIRGSGTLCHTVVVNGYNNNRIITVDPDMEDCNSTCRIPIFPRLMPEDWFRDYITLDSSSNIHVDLLKFQYRMPLIDFKIYKTCEDEIIISSIKVESKSTFVIGSEVIYEPNINKWSYNKNLNEYTGDTTQFLDDQKLVSSNYKDFYMALPPNNFPENDLTFTITFTRNGVEESLIINRDRNLVLKEWEMSVIKIKIQ